MLRMHWHRISLYPGRLRYKEFNQALADSDILFFVAKPVVEKFYRRDYLYRQIKNGLHSGAQLLLMSRSRYVVSDWSYATIFRRSKTQYKPFCYRISSFCGSGIRKVDMRICLSDGSFAGLGLQDKNTEAYCAVSAFKVFKVPYSYISCSAASDAGGTRTIRFR